MYFLLFMLGNFLVVQQHKPSIVQNNYLSLLLQGGEQSLFAGSRA